MTVIWLMWAPLSQVPLPSREVNRFFFSHFQASVFGFILSFAILTGVSWTHSYVAYVFLIAWVKGHFWNISFPLFFLLLNSMIRSMTDHLVVLLFLDSLFIFEFHVYFGYLSSIKYIAGNYSYPFCGLLIHLLNCVFGCKEALWFYNVFGQMDS